jgi:hypothetical protein
LFVILGESFKSEAKEPERIYVDLSRGAHGYYYHEGLGPQSESESTQSQSQSQSQSLSQSQDQTVIACPATQDA